MVGRLKGAEIGHEQVQSAIAIEVHRLDVRRMRQLREWLQPEASTREAAIDDAGSHVAGHQVEALVAVEVHEPDVGDRDAPTLGAACGTASKASGSLTAGHGSGSGSRSGASLS